MQSKQPLNDFFERELGHRKKIRKIITNIVSAENKR